MLLSASEGGVACVCAYMDVFVYACACFHMLLCSAGGGHVRTAYINSWRTTTAKQTQGWVAAHHHTQHTTRLNYFAEIQSGEPGRPLQSPLTKVILSEDTASELTVSATQGGDTGERKKPGKAPGLQSKRHCTVSGPQCKCLCFSFESGLW